MWQLLGIVSVLIPSAIIVAGVALRDHPASRPQEKPADTNKAKAQRIVAAAKVGEWYRVVDAPVVLLGTEIRSTDSEWH